MRPCKIFDTFSRILDNRRSRDFSDSLGLRDGSEMVIADVCVKGNLLYIFKWTSTTTVLLTIKLLCSFGPGEKKRHHHHHHKSSHRSDFREPNLVGNARREHRQSTNGHY